MAKKEIDQNIQEIKNAVENKKCIFGVKETIKLLSKGSLQKVFVARNVPADIRDDLEHYSKIAKVDLVVLKQDNEEVGILVKKNFFVSVIGIFP